MQMTAETIWASAQQHLRALLNADIYHLWFAPLRALTLEQEVLTLQVANDFCEVWLNDNYLGLMRDVLAQTSGLPLKVKFQIAANHSAPLLSDAEKAQKAEEIDPAQGASATAELPLPFNPKNTFDTFVVGSNNTFAHAAAMAVAQCPGKSYNPLFLYGGVGLGKTHLLHAIGQHVASQKKGARVT